MATPAAQFQQEHQAVCTFLLAQSKVLGSGAAKVQAAQSNSLALKLGAVSMNHAEAAQLTEAVSEGPWTDEQKAALASAIAASLQGAGSETGRQRRSAQVLNCFSSYLRAADLDLLRSSAGLSMKLHCCVELCLQIGLVLPNEPTIGGIIKTIAALGCDALRDANYFLSAVQEFKRLLRARSKNFKTLVHLAEYPADPGALPPNLKEAAYSEAAPAGVQLALPASSTGAAPLRKSASSVRPQALQGMAPLAAACSQPGMMQLLSLLAGQAAPAPAAGLANLHIFQPQKKQAELTTPPHTPAQLPSQSQTPALTTASPPAASQLPTPTSTTSTSTAVSPNQLQLEDGPARDPLSPEDQAELMLQAFQTRADEGKKPEHAAAKKPKKGSAKAKALPKGKAKALPKGKARAKASVAPVKPKVKAAAKAVRGKDPQCKGWSKEDKYEHYKSMSSHKRQLLRPSGCKKCRGKAGCTPSCFV